MLSPVVILNDELPDTVASGRKAACDVRQVDGRGDLALSGADAVIVRSDTQVLGVRRGCTSLAAPGGPGRHGPRRCCRVRRCRG